MSKNFEFQVIVFRPTPKTITLGLVRLEGFLTFSDFQFKFLPIDIIHHIRINSSRKKMRQNEKALILALISFLSLNRLCSKNAPEHIIIE